MIIIGSDHAGTTLKQNIISYLKSKNIEYMDINEDNKEDDDYPDIAYMICKKVADSNNKGIAICGTGIGVSIACNKVQKIRAANCFNTYMAKMCRAHNDANILCLGARVELDCNVNDIVEAFLNTEFEGGRHTRRLDKIKEIEKNNKGGI